jgi:hypothetical protein
MVESAGGGGDPYGTRAAAEEQRRLNAEEAIRQGKETGKNTRLTMILATLKSAANIR